MPLRNLLYNYAQLVNSDFGVLTAIHTNLARVRRRDYHIDVFADHQ